MTFRRAPPSNIVLTHDEHKRAATVVTMLVTIAKQTKKVRSNNNGSYFAKASKDTKTKCTYNDRGPWICGPCFYLKQGYHKAINIEKMLTKLLNH